MSIGRYFLARAVQLVLIMFGISTILFVLLHLSGNPAQIEAGPNASPQVVAAFARRLGLNLPLPDQYVRYMAGIFTLNFGNSIQFDAPALALVLQRLPATLELAAGALLLTVLLAIPAGVVSAASPRRGLKAATAYAALVGQAAPPYWLGLVLILVFAVTLRLVPAVGSGSFLQLILPSVSLSAFLVPKVVRLAQVGMEQALAADYVRTALAKGLSRQTVVWRHAFRNAVLGVVAILGYQAALLVGGAVVIETVFAWPGIGSFVVQAAMAADYPIIQATVFVVTVLVVAISLAVDLLYRLLDPRLREVA